VHPFVPVLLSFHGQFASGTKKEPIVSEDHRKDPVLSDGPGHQVDKEPPAPSSLAEERDHPGLDAKGTGAAGAPKPKPGSRTGDREVGDRLDE